MFILGKKEVDIIEYTCSSTRKLNSRLHKKSDSRVGGKLEFSAIKLSVALARTILSSDPSNLDLMFQICSSFFNMQSMIDTKSRNLKVNINVLNKYRDFSLTSRIGELAQAVNYLFVQEMLKYPAVVDYEGFISNQKNSLLPKYVGEIPDFIASKNNMSEIIIIESKGSLPAKKNFKLKSILREALDQCDNGKFYIEKNLPFNVKNTFSSGVWFSKPSNNWNTTLHFSDPSYDSNYSLSESRKLLRYHYSSWFALFGYYKIVFELLEDDGNLFNALNTNTTIEIKNEKYYIFDLNQYSNDYKYYISNFFDLFDNKVMAFGISCKVWNFLKDSYVMLNLDEFWNDSVSSDKMELFADGTVLLFDNFFN